MTTTKVPGSTIDSNADIGVNSSVFGSPTGGNQGAGTINAEAIYINGVDITTLSGGSSTVENFADGVGYTSGTDNSITLATDPESENNILVFFDGLQQHHDTYTVTGMTVNFDANIPLGTNNIEVVIGPISSGSTVNNNLIIPCSDETTDIATGTSVMTFRLPSGYEISEVRASVNEAPTGSAITVDINIGGASILSTKLTIDDGEETSVTAATPPVLSSTVFADDAKVEIDIDAVGSTTPGKGLKVTLIGKEV